MRILIISDIHGNFDALAALQETYDEVWVLGDLVNYGPDPAAVIDFVRSKAAVASSAGITITQSGLTRTRAAPLDSAKWLRRRDATRIQF